jgi:type II secretory pathway pseudopilin PulG
MRAGWTLIELIFIIVIIGILAAVAIHKLAATRDDAKLSTTVSNMAICIKDANAAYLATKTDYTDAVHSTPCDRNNTLCYTISYAVNGADFNVTTNPAGAAYCADIENVGGHLAKSYTFGGSTVER